MKLLILMMLLVCTTVIGCTTTYPAAPIPSSFDNTVVLRVECRSDQSLSQLVIQHLKTTHATDIKINKQGAPADMEIEATYVDAPENKLWDIIQTLKQTPGVFFIKGKRLSEPAFRYF